MPLFISNVQFANAGWSAPAVALPPLRSSPPPLATAVFPRHTQLLKRGEAFCT
jgi:hypothetical protein